jgi:hypothetical protein
VDFLCVFFDGWFFSVILIGIKALEKFWGIFLMFFYKKLECFLLLLIWYTGTNFWFIWNGNYKVIQIFKLRSIPDKIIGNYFNINYKKLKKKILKKIFLRFHHLDDGGVKFLRNRTLDFSDMQPNNVFMHNIDRNISSKFRH